MSAFEDMNKETEEFMNYLEQFGVLDQITETLIKLYNEPELPSDPIEYVRMNMSTDNQDLKEIAELESLIKIAVVELAELKSIRDELKIKVEQLENDGYEGEEDDAGSTLNHEDVLK